MLGHWCRNPGQADNSDGSMICNLRFQTSGHRDLGSCESLLVSWGLVGWVEKKLEGMRRETEVRVEE